MLNCNVLVYVAVHAPMSILIRVVEAVSAALPDPSACTVVRAAVGFLLVVLAIVSITVIVEIVVVALREAQDRDCSGVGRSKTRQIACKNTQQVSPQQVSTFLYPVHVHACMLECMHARVTTWSLPNHITGNPNPAHELNGTDRVLRALLQWQQKRRATLQGP
eukprot:m.164711 g.164711  ORF g.164711 m.164711 type:complete len:163 (-) comp10317_c0_seq5:54-542(-)